MNFPIETGRLLIRPIALTDEAGMFQMDADAMVHKYLGNNPVTTIEQIRENIKMIQKQYDDFGIGRWAVIEKETNTFVGWTGFKYIKETVNGHVHYYDFGYRYAQNYWGKGYATEAGAAALKYGLAFLKLSPVYAMTDINNTGSRKVLEKLGFTYVETFPYESATLAYNGPTTWYKLK